MAEFQSSARTLPFIPNNLTVPQFFLDYTHPIRPFRKDGEPWMIDDETGREVGYEEVNFILGVPNRSIESHVYSSALAHLPWPIR